ncbi:MAG TPA: hypothetical protein VI789_02930 [Dehalococcoidia bacterium]|nr:hypothetical protein [Dehalococcoidia bacterium]
MTASPASRSYVWSDVKGTLPSLIAAFLTALALFALAGFQVTSHQAATRLLGRQGAALIEIDRWLPAHRDDLDLIARDRPESVVALRDVPLNIVLPSTQVIDVDNRVLRATIVRAMGERLYTEGTDAFRNREGLPQKPGYDDPLRWSVSLLGESAHGFWKAALAVIALALLASIGGVLLKGASPLTPLAIGAGFAAVMSLLVWMLTDAIHSSLSAPVDQEIVLALHDGAWIGLRNGLAVAVVMAGMHILLASFSNRDRPWGSETWDLPDTEADPDAPPV